MFEVELKAKVIALEDTLNYLVRNGFRVVKYFVKDVYFSHPCRDFEETQEEFRFRVEEKGGKKRYILTYKGPSIFEDRSAREELEIELRGDISIILERLGFSKYATKEKEGWFLERDDLEITLCSVRGEFSGRKFFLGEFVEVELKVSDANKISEARKEVYDFISKLPGVGEIDPEYFMEKLKKLASKS